MDIKIKVDGACVHDGTCDVDSIARNNREEMKRGREEAAGFESARDMVNCLMLLSKVGQTEAPDGRFFTCKTCNRKFASFQALGGHRASHKKPKLVGDDFLKLPSSPPKPKTHECPICGLEFPIGQALGVI
ncbi:hypothetical protein GH714_013229 [Hevea brasiliensis]|uniref:C2H2-type domain-containing protein n=1 Tax=Hevea brasiliensis TaxID=3981 RepID=A0A6A6LJZ8_HEVBR|nr:hypothetical protein GH714_013229 [Hevea brasiliensis]